MDFTIQEGIIDPKEFRKQTEEIIYPIINIGDLTKVDDWVINLIYSISESMKGNTYTLAYDYEGVTRIMNKIENKICKLSDILGITKSFKITKSDRTENTIFSIEEFMEVC